MSTEPPKPSPTHPDSAETGEPLRIYWIIVPVALAVATVAKLALGLKAGDPGLHRPLDGFGYVLAATPLLSLALMKRRPGLGLALAVTASVGYTLADYPPHPGQFAVGAALFLAMVAGAYRAALAVSLVAGLAAIVIGPQVIDDATVTDLGRILMFVIPTIPVAAGYVYRAQRQQVAALTERLELIQRAEQARDERDEANLRVEIARDLHDTVGHAIAVISVQSGAALSVLDSDPDTARKALLTINEYCRSAMAETRRALAALRGEGPARPPSVAETMAAAESAGLVVEHRGGSDLAGIDTQIEEVIRRLAQESVTNTLTHSTADAVELTIAVNERAVSFEFIDNGSAKAEPKVDGGSGLAGMADRVTAIDGRFEAGPTDEGFRVAAQVPRPVGV